MLFVYYTPIVLYGIPLAIILLGAWVYSLVRYKGPLWRAIWRTAAIALASLGLLVLLVEGFAEAVSKTSRSDAVFSEDRRHAVRITDFDYGATGGDTEVDVFSDYGLRNKTVLSGEWKIVEAQDVHWLSNSELLLEYYPGYGIPTCSDFDGVRVTCRPSARRTWQQ